MRVLTFAATTVLVVLLCLTASTSVVEGQSAFHQYLGGLPQLFPPSQ
jgi:hypothetical protein